MMTITPGPNIFITTTPADFCHDGLSRHSLQMSNAERDKEMTEGGHTPSNRGVPVSVSKEFMEFQTVKLVLHILKEGRMDVVRFLNALYWGNTLAVVDPATRSARTSLTHSDRLAGVVLHWLQPPQTFFFFFSFQVYCARVVKLMLHIPYL